MGFDNILMSLGQSPAPAASTNATLEDYNLFDRLRKEGRSLQDIVRQAEEAESLRKQVEELSRQPPVDEDVFPVMEQAVGDDPEVVSAREAMTRARNAVISSMLMRDPVFKDAYGTYRQTVRTRYVALREKGPETPVREDSETDPA